ncbi:MAG TPA: alpha/beta fold hydrolase [Dermatophilaceae bacterium]|nr:alpha/beta fold hydrolase [Dermatophilaceae bacterium]
MRFVLVHGSWHDERCWDAVIARLADAGHDATAITLPGNGFRQDPGTTMADAAAAVAEHIRDLDLHEVVLVGHSFGGAVVQLAAEQVADRLARIVFYNAYVVEPGRSVLSYVPASAGQAFAALAAPDGTLELPFEFVREHLLADADDDTARAAYAMLSPEPLGRSGEVLDLTRFAELTVPMSYVHATDDKVFPPEELTWHPGMSGHLRSVEVFELPGGHELMFSDPAALADVLVRAAHG